MAGTRSQTGNARPRVFQTVDTEPTISRKPGATGPKAKGTAAAPAVGTTPARGAGGVTKKKKTTPAKKTGGVAAKAKVAANKVEKKAAGATRAATKVRFY
ncbi:uncharacterized protein J7T54_005632 [Emericellopsis cladophorae]|uniref:Uncharacterized protein n=1 Tax=Emericellopsis cladophorae TaxID=2686198 RepID=A0A9P9Y5G5_9HYPO|nr:uncharacterized protein J7T54_005632 [Emericellopsis cladophorae]KAI6783603.1 hypothetical protein J7T54_005632 [Emericellopsis cladophorae]